MMRGTGIIVLLAALILLSAPGARAAVNLARVTPAAKTLNADLPARVSLTWTIRTTGGVAVTVETDDGEFRINGNTVDVLPALPAQTKTSAFPANSFLFTFTETITVPSALIRRSIESNQPLTFRRVFSDDSFATSTNVDVSFAFTGGIGGPLAVARLRLAFDDGSSICNAEAGKDMIVSAFIETEGSGLLRGSWQVRENIQAGGYRTLKTVQTPVGAGRNLVLESPPIPVNDSGRVDVRFHIDNPDVRFDEPFVTCAVSGIDPLMIKRVPVGRPAAVISPRPFSPLDGNTLIEWQAVDGARAYRIEILADKDGEPVAAQSVKTDKLTNTLSPVVIGKLDPKRRYIVRVFAE